MSSVGIQKPVRALLVPRCFKDLWLHLRDSAKTDVTVSFKHLIELILSALKEEEWTEVLPVPLHVLSILGPYAPSELASSLWSLKTWL